MDNNWGTTVTTSPLYTRRRGLEEVDKNEGLGGMWEDDAVGPVGSHACELDYVVQGERP